MSAAKAEKFAKKGHLVVDLDGKSPKMAVVGDKDSQSVKILKKAGIKEKPEAAEKPAKGKVSKKAKEEATEKAPDNRKLKLLVKENPKREGSAAHGRYELYRTSKTVAAFLEAGGRTADLRYDEQKGYIEVA